MEWTGQWAGQWVRATPMPRSITKVWRNSIVSYWIHYTWAWSMHTLYSWHGPYPIHRLSTHLSTEWGVSGHNICYQTFPLLSNEIRSALHDFCMLASSVPGVDPHPVIGSPSPLTWCGSHPPHVRIKQKEGVLGYACQA